MKFARIQKSLRLTWGDNKRNEKDLHHKGTRARRLLLSIFLGGFMSWWLIPMLEIKNLQVSFGAINALHGISLSLKHGSIVTLIGANGSGKTTTLKTISGLLRPRAGEIFYEGKNIVSLSPHQIVKLGLSHVPEGRMIFANLTVLENLQLGAYLQKDKQIVRRELERVFNLFPRLQERVKQIAGTLSGGEQQMLAIGRALMSKPKLLLLDEPSLGLAPLLVKTIFEKIVEINRQQGLTILLVEQNANLALDISHFGYVLETGKIILQDNSAALRQNPQVKSAYLGG
jgi:branched-chain amino acid transport system ATP-binding protein